jgi:spermidine synthase
MRPRFMDLREMIGSVMTTRRSVMMTLLSLFVLLCAVEVPAQAYDRDAGFVEHEVQSAFSHIRIRRNGFVRTMIFVRDNGEEAWESQMNLKSPHVLRFTYLQHMFASYLLQPKQSKVLIVGLGGGSMVHFLQKHDPTVAVDAVEIDPVVVQLAEQSFNGNTVQ